MSKLSKAFDEASSALSRAIVFSSDLNKAGHDAMHHHALHAAAACKAGKMDEAAQHSFMHMRHAVENARGKDYYGMSDAVERNVRHYKQEAQDELNAPGYQRGYGGAEDAKKKKHKLVKHFEDGGKFTPHPGDKSFKEDYKGNKDGPKMGKK